MSVAPYFILFEYYRAMQYGIQAPDDSCRTIEASVFADARVEEREKTLIREIIHEGVVFDDGCLERLKTLSDAKIRFFEDYRTALALKGISPLNDESDIYRGETILPPLDMLVDEGNNEVSFRFNARGKDVEVLLGLDLDRHSEEELRYLGALLATRVIQGDDDEIDSLLADLEMEGFERYREVQIEEDRENKQAESSGEPVVDGYDALDYHLFPYSYTISLSIEGMPYTIELASDRRLSEALLNRIVDVVDQLTDREKECLLVTRLKIFSVGDAISEEEIQWSFIGGVYCIEHNYLFLNVDSISLGVFKHELAHAELRLEEVFGPKNRQPMMLDKHYKSQIRRCGNAYDPECWLDSYSAGGLFEMYAVARQVMDASPGFSLHLFSLSSLYNSDEELFKKDPVLYLLMLRDIDGSDEDRRFRYTLPVYLSADEFVKRLKKEGRLKPSAGNEWLAVDVNYSTGEDDFSLGFHY